MLCSTKLVLLLASAAAAGAGAGGGGGGGGGEEEDEEEDDDEEEGEGASGVSSSAGFRPAAVTLAATTGRGTPTYSFMMRRMRMMMKRIKEASTQYIHQCKFMCNRA